ncbi:MAG: hypothetical protein K5893_04615 [Prevotella sp.]|nr:hypothetical protein [Prevotella sp.]
MKHLKYVFIAVMTTILAACGGDDDPVSGGLPFNLEQQAEVAEGYSLRMSIYSGNGDYSLNIADGSIARATYAKSMGGVDFGSIIVEGLKQGSTVLTVTDNKAGKSIGVDIKVISPNYHMTIPVTSGHKALTREVVWCMVPSQKAERDVMFFRSDGVGLHYLTRGTYSTENDAEGNTKLIMRYPMAADSTLVTTESAALTTHRFQLNAPSAGALAILTATEPLTGTAATQTATVEMTEEGTSRKLSANIVYGPLCPLIIPFGYLQ